MNYTKIFQRDVEVSRYRPEIDGLRFLAIAVVMIGHLAERVQKFWLNRTAAYDSQLLNAGIDFLARPGNGVALFFLISGFVIGRQMQEKCPGDFGGHYLLTYYVRRGARIFPPYFLILILTFSVLTVTGITPPGTDRIGDISELSPSFFASLIYSHGIIFDSLPNLFPPGWSLEVEVQFYLLAPFLFLSLCYFRGRVVAIYLLLLAVSFLVSSFILTLGVQHLRISILANSFYFCVGIFCARFEGRIGEAFSKVGSLGGLAIAIFSMLGMIYLGGKGIVFPEWLKIGAVGGFSFLLFGLAIRSDTLWGRFCRLPIASSLGMMCYSLYLVHMQLFHLFAVVCAKNFPFGYSYILLFGVLALALSLIVGVGFFIFVEKPFANRNWPRVVTNIFRGRGRDFRRH